MPRTAPRRGTDSPTGGRRARGFFPMIIRAGAFRGDRPKQGDSDPRQDDRQGRGRGQDTGRPATGDRDSPTGGRPTETTPDSPDTPTDTEKVKKREKGSFWELLGAFGGVFLFIRL